MSRWLRSVGNFLEKLDDKAADVIVQNRSEDDDDGAIDSYTRDVLAAHGVLQDETNGIKDCEEDDGDVLVKQKVEDAEDDPMDNNDPITMSDQRINDDVVTEPLDITGATPAVVIDEDSNIEGSNVPPPLDVPNTISEQSFTVNTNNTNRTDSRPIEDASLIPAESKQQEAPFHTPQPIAKSIPSSHGGTSTNTSGAPAATVSQTPMFHTPAQIPLNELPNEVADEVAAPSTTVPVPAAAKVASLPEDSQLQQERLEEKLGLERQIQALSSQLATVQTEHKVILQALGKQGRTLQRQLADTQRQLQHAHAEMDAQRNELEMAATRLDTQRTQQKQQLQSLTTKHAAELAAAVQTHQEALATMQQQAAAQKELQQNAMLEMQRQRQAEGGDWHEQLDAAVQREAATHHELLLLQDENQTLQARVETLQLQQDALGSRVESLQAAADVAASREREAERRLDDVLERQAQQLSQRQGRESELERTVASLSAALAKYNDSSNSSGNNSNSKNQEQGVTNPITAPHASAAQEMIDTLMVELEGTKSQLEQERQQRTSLQREVSEMAHERTVDERLQHARQVEHDRLVNDLSRQVAELRATLQQHDTSTNSNGRGTENSTSNTNATDTARAQSLRDEVMRLRDRTSANHSEIAALRVRLQDALNRATIAEAAAESSLDTGLSQDNDTDDDPESGMVRRRNGMGQRNHRHRHLHTPKTPTMRAALSIDSLSVGGSDSRQRIGKSLDTLDKFLSESGKVLRYNPMARLLFVVYLLVLHLWTLALLVFHAHGFETVHGDFGSPIVGPGALMQSAAQAQVVPPPPPQLP